MLGFRLLWRDWRGGELGILLSALIVAVAIVTGIALFAERIDQGLAAQSNNFLAADRVLETSSQVANEWLRQADSIGLNRGVVLSFPSMVYVGNSMQRAAVKAVSGTYPLRGSLEVSDEPFAAGYKLQAAPPAGEVWIDSRLFPQLDIAIGDMLGVGEISLKVTRVVISEPDNSGNPLGFGPRVLMNIDDIAATNVVRPGSRVEYRYLFAGDEEQLDQYGAWLVQRMDKEMRWIKLQDAQPRIARALERAETFLLLAGSLGVGLAGIAIALAARRYSERHFDYVAMMKSLGASSRRILSLYGLNLVLLACIAVIAGWVAGWLIQFSFMVILREYIPVSELPPLGYKPFITGAITALVCLLAFALPPMIGLKNVSPLRVIRRDDLASPLSASLTYTLGVAGLTGLMWWYSGSWLLTLSVLSGVALTFVIVGAFAWIALRGTQTIGMQAGSTMGLALASLRRRGVQNALQVVIFSLAIMLLLMLSLIRTSIIEEWQLQLPEKTPNHFLLNVTPEQVPSVEELLAERAFSIDEQYPIVRGRLTHINGSAVDEALPDEQSRQNVDRPFNMTWSENLPYENSITSGKWWDDEPAQQSVSVEQGLAERLGIRVGDELQFSIGSDVLSVNVASIRSLNWDSMRPNFFMIFPPSVLGEYPATYISSFYLPPDQKSFLNEFVNNFPTVVIIEVDAIIAQIRTIVGQVSSAIELVLALILVSGLLVLIASVKASLDERFRESAILRTLGARRNLVLGGLVIEFAVLGFLAGLMGAFTAEVSVFLLQTQVLDMRFSPHPWVWVFGPLLGALMTAITGYISCRKVVDISPVQVLRDI